MKNNLILIITICSLFMVVFACKVQAPKPPKDALYSEQIKYAHYQNEIYKSLKNHPSDSIMTLLKPAENLLAEVMHDYGKIIVVYGPTDGTGNDDPPEDPDCDDDIAGNNGGNGGNGNNGNSNNNDDDKIPCELPLEHIDEFVSISGNVYEVVFFSRSNDTLGTVDFSKATRYANKFIGYPIKWYDNQKLDTLIVQMTDTQRKSIYKTRIRIEN